MIIALEAHRLEAIEHSLFRAGVAHHYESFIRLLRDKVIGVRGLLQKGRHYYVDVRIQISRRQLRVDNLQSQARVLGHLRSQIVCLLYDAFDALFDDLTVRLAQQVLVELSDSLDLVEPLEDFLPVIRLELRDSLLELLVWILQRLLNRIVSGSCLLLAIHRILISCIER